MATTQRARAKESDQESNMSNFLNYIHVCDAATCRIWSKGVKCLEILWKIELKSKVRIKIHQSRILTSFTELLSLIFKNYGALIFETKKTNFWKKSYKIHFWDSKGVQSVNVLIMNMHMQNYKKISNFWRFIAKYSEKVWRQFFDLQCLEVLNINHRRKLLEVLNINRRRKLKTYLETWGNFETETCAV